MLALLLPLFSVRARAVSVEEYLDTGTLTQSLPEEAEEWMEDLVPGALPDLVRPFDKNQYGEL